jgi:hypothetical protein
MKEINSVDDFSSYLDKIVVIKDFIRVLNEIVCLQNKGTCSADDLLTATVYILIRSSPKMIRSNLRQWF